MNSAIPRTPAMHLDGNLEIEVAQRSLAGCKPVNEDCVGIRIPSGNLLTTKGAVAIIADGVSAAEAGKEASETCVQSFINDYYSTPDSWSVQKSALQVLTALNSWLCVQGNEHLHSRRGHVSTLTALIIKSHTAHVFHVGDSRAYRLRGDELEQLSRDHATNVDENRSYLTRAMGLDRHLEVDYLREPIDINDLFLLSTDGMHNFVSAALLQQTLLKNPSDLEQTCDELLKLAGNTSDDNLSCQLLRVTQLPLANADDVFQKLTALPFPPFLQQGMTLDGLRIESELHASNRSQLYLVTDTDSGKRLVLKTPSVNFQDDPAYIERFVMESWIGTRISNSHVLRIVQRDRPPSCLYYLTEYVSGMTLQQWISEHPRAPVNEVVFLAEQLIKAVRALHRRDTLHQDIKPGNILIDSTGLLKLIDFGSCRVASIAEISVPMERDLALGTADYSAPEYMTRCHLPTQRSDLFSIAVIIYEMLSGELPFKGKLAECRSAADLSRLEYIPCYTLNPLVPLWIDGAVKKALQPTPGLRYAEVSEFLHDLKHPNMLLPQSASLPLIERNPLLFWRTLAIILVLMELITLYLLW